MIAKNPREPEPTIDSTQFALAEYDSLRAEMLKRTEFQHQIITATLLIGGTFISIGVQQSIDPLVLLIYPLLAMFLAAGWATNNLRIQRIGTYIRDHIESQVLGGGYEQHRVSSTKNIKNSMNVLFARGTFIVTQLVALAVAFPKMSFTLGEMLFLLGDGVAILLTFYIVRRLPNM